MKISHPGRLIAILLISLPLLSNAISLIIFAPLFDSDRTSIQVDFRSASIWIGISVLVIELGALLLIVSALRRENQSLKDVINFKGEKLHGYLLVGIMALLPTLFAGWLYSRGQAQAGVEINLLQLGWGEIGLWYVLTPVSSALLEETIWRGYALPRLAGIWRGFLFTSLSFALFHGIFNPLAVIAAFVQGLVWGWVYQRTGSTAPGMALHFLSRYLALIPGFG